MNNPRAEHVTGDLYALVPAAGAGSRMNSDTPKQYMELNGVSILNHTIERLLSLKSVKMLVVVQDEAMSTSDNSAFDDNPRITRCAGGASRAESVRNGLRHLSSCAGSTDMVLVHDAARPCVRVNEIEQLVATVADDSHGGLLAMPMVDTIKRADPQMQVLETINRDQLWRAATPQLFRYTVLLDALENALQEGAEITDEASAMERSGYTPRLLPCSTDNIKVTTATDLVLAEFYLSAQEAGV